MKNSWKKVVAMMIAAALCVSCSVTGFSEDIEAENFPESSRWPRRRIRKNLRRRKRPRRNPRCAGPEPVRGA